MSTPCTPTIDELRARGRWNPLWDRLADWDPEWTEHFLVAATSPWKSGVLQPKTIELICIAGDAACSHLYAPGTRRHVRAALELGATRDEILAVLKLASLLGFQTIHFAVPILAAELGEPGHASAVSQLRRWDGDWAAQVAEVTASSRNGVLDSKTVELICIGLNAAATHLNGDALRHHIKAALDAGVSRGEIIEVFKVASTLGIHACNVGVPILDEELASRRAQR